MRDEKMRWKDAESLDGAASAGGTGRVLRSDSEDPVDMPLGIGGFGDDGDPIGLEGTGSKSSPRINRSGALLMVIVLCVGGGTLWTMRITGAIGTANPEFAEAEAKIEKALERFLGTKNPTPGQAGEALGELFGDTDEMIIIFSDDPTANQVPVDNVQKNPFELFVKPPVGPAALAARPDDAARHEADQQRQLQAELDRLTLNSVLIGKEPVAVIADKVLKEGQTIGSFTVKSISATSVELTAEGKEYRLTLPEGPQGEPAGRAPGGRPRR